MRFAFLLLLLRCCSSEQSRRHDALVRRQRSEGVLSADVAFDGKASFMEPASTTGTVASTSATSATTTTAAAATSTPSTTLTTTVGPCGEGRYKTGGTCKSCDESCKDCLGLATNCTACATNKLLDSSSCKSECPEGKFASSNRTCLACDSSCKSCEGLANACTSCQEEDALDGSVCLSECPLGKRKAMSGRCVACKSSCRGCNARNQCTSCQPDRVLRDGGCHRCKQGEFVVTENQASRCETCDSSCLHCLGNASFCTHCKEGEVLFNNACLSKCPEGFFGKSCKPCDSQCRSCRKWPKSCTSCSAPLLGYGVWPRMQCLEECPKDKPLFPIDGRCRRCDNNCLSCEGSISNCTSCRARETLEEGRCVEDCPEGKYEKDNVCQPCSPEKSCRTCAWRSGSDSCLSCFDPMSLHNGTCVVECPAGYYTKLIGGRRRCRPCHARCEACSGSQGNCTACKAGYILDGTECRESCAPGKFAAGDFCRRCDAACKTCEGSDSSCSSCSEPGLLSNGTCVQKCPTGHFGKNNRCRPCDPKCFTCEEAKSCSSCVSQLYLLEDQCVEECPKGTYKSPDQVCVKCHRTCASCDRNASQCTSCAAQMVLENGLCSERCSAGKFASEGVCEKCDDSCATCTGTARECESCAAPLILEGSKCLSACPDGKFDVRGQCRGCHASCAACSVTASNCTACPDGEVLDGSTCKVACPDGKYAEQKVCKDCDASCATCGGGGGCITCFPGEKKILHEERCVASCPAGYLPDLKATPPVCTACSSRCATCDIVDTNCTSCNPGDVRDGSRCLEGCRLGTFDGNRTCLPCQKPCATCQGAGDHCLQCLEELNMVATEGVCSCPKGTYWAGESCERCDKSCATCNGAALNCTTCHSMAILEGSTCNCPDGMFTGDDGKCAPCDPSCRTCAGSSSSCTSCVEAQGRSLQAGRCVCPRGSFGANSTGHICEKCQCPCAECWGTATNCTACSGKARLEGTASGATCACPETAFLASPLRDDGGCGTCKACSTGGLCATCRESPRICTSCVASHYLLGTSCLAECPDNHLAEKGRCRSLLGAVVSLEGVASILTAAACQSTCPVTALPKSNAVPADRQWLVEDAQEGTVALRSLHFGSLLNATDTYKTCWPDHGSAACSNMQNLRFRAVFAGEGRMGLLSSATSRYLILLADSVSYSEAAEKAPVPASAFLQPKILTEAKESELRFFGSCDKPIEEVLECKQAAARQGILKYSQFSPWKGDEAFPPFCFYLTEAQGDLAITRLVLNLRAGAAPSSYRRYAPCSRAQPCLCRK